MESNTFNTFNLDLRFAWNPALNTTEKYQTKSPDLHNLARLINSRRLVLTKSDTYPEMEIFRMKQSAVVNGESIVITIS
jgi:hypothetical protein